MTDRHEREKEYFEEYIKRERGTPDFEYRRGKKREVSTSIGYVHDYIEQNNTNIDELDFRGLESWIRGCYSDFSTANRILEEAKKYILLFV